jgi:hypothetical protein
MGATRSIDRNEENDPSLHRVSEELDKEEDGFSRIKREETIERDVDGGASLKLIRGAEFPIGPKGIRAAIHYASDLASGRVVTLSEAG